MTEISPHAIVSEDASIGEGTQIAALTIINPGVRLGRNCTIGSHCVLGEIGPAGEPLELEIGDGAVVRSHSVLYGGSTFGPGLRTGHRVTMREGIRAGRALQVGTVSDLQGDSEFGD